MNRIGNSNYHSVHTRQKKGEPNREPYKTTAVMKQRQLLSQRLWFPLLLLVVFCSRRRHESCHRFTDGSSSSSTAYVFGPTFADASDSFDVWNLGRRMQTIERDVCQSDRCIPNCECGLSSNSSCALDYGIWGWVAPEDSVDDVWRNMPLEYDIDYGVIKPAGMRGAGRVTGIGEGIATLPNITNSTVTGEIYFEIHPDQLAPNLGEDPVNLVVSMYGGMDFGLSDCTEGIMLGKRLVNMSGVDDAVDNFNYFIKPYDDYNEVFFDKSIECHPRSVNGVMAALVFTLNEPFYYDEQSPSLMNIWYPFRIDADYGTMEFCVRVEMIDPSYVSLNDDFDDDYYKKKDVTSYIDTKFKVDISAPDETNNYTRFSKFQEVKLYSNQPIGPTPDTTTFLPIRYKDIITIPVRTFVCSAPDESDVKGSFDPGRTFLDGQTFRLCVVPVDEKNYKVVSFKSVVCEKDGRSKTIIDELGIPDELTIIENITLGFTKLKGGIVISNRTVSIDSIINDVLEGDIPEDGEKIIVCSGTVILDRLITEEYLAAMDAVFEPGTNITNAESILVGTLSATIDLTHGSTTKKDEVMDKVSDWWFGESSPGERIQSSSHLTLGASILISFLFFA